MNLAETIIAKAVNWYEQQCYEVTGNRGPCIDMIHELYNQAWIEDHTSEAYCAEFVSVVLKQAFGEFGKSAPIYTASAVGMLNAARAKNITIDKRATPGAVFYKKSSAAGSSGHVGIVTKIDGSDKFYTIEGNARDPNTGREGVVNLIRKFSTDDSIKIIHVENYVKIDSRSN
ncbi:MAG: CHAP domain-containing protein [Patescibacteria group bacterium]